MDLLPTVMSLAQLNEPVPAEVEGGNLVAVLRDPAGAGRVQRSREELVSISRTTISATGAP
jgi:hypothetical protein